MVATSVKEAIVGFIMEHQGLNKVDALTKFDKIMQGRFATDIFE